MEELGFLTEITAIAYFDLIFRKFYCFYQYVPDVVKNNQLFKKNNKENYKYSKYVN